MSLINTLCNCDAITIASVTLSNITEARSGLPGWPFQGKISEILPFLKWFGSEKWCFAFTLLRCQYLCEYLKISKLLTIGKFGLFLGCLALYDKLLGIFCFLGLATLCKTEK